MTEHPDLAQQLHGLDLDRPNIARMYDYMLGGAANFAIDRTAAEDFSQEFPWIVRWAHANRAFLGRAVTHLALRGIDQFLDLGSGVPTVGNVHEIAHRHNPAARVAYVDWEPIAVHHTKFLLGQQESRVTITQADIREPETVLSEPGVAGLLDFTRPVAVLAVAILDIAGTDDTAALIGTYREACCPGSALVISHGVRTSLTEAEAVHFQRFAAQHANTPHAWRTPAELRALFAGYDLLEPGLVPTPQWSPDAPISDEHARQFNAYGAVGIRA